MRSSYDYDVSTFSPQGRLHQVSYAMESPKLGSPCVGIKTKTHVILAAIKRQIGPLSSHQPKLFDVDGHIGIAVSGLYADARKMTKYLRMECVEHSYVFNADHPTRALIVKLADKSQAKTQFAGSRPYGAALLVAGMDKAGPRLYQTCPSGNYYEWHCISIGSRSQTIKTYLESHLEDFKRLEGEESIETLIDHAICALSMGSRDGKLTKENVAIGIVGKDHQWRQLPEEVIAQAVEVFEARHPDLAAVEESEDDVSMD
eukprot:gnl/Dysnectes_brevis/1205_a1347_2172.p1 GENE.gnl/Dysnectes_brevis/1205_a1347_2172~~gnl/Dysnectes_brevis/1205_a1347_2172.p1  ORF type:complete len:259 (+),score=63.86 gnl/Dysnectes_brevis/1205_a1347_2172:720-1496(+)